MWSTMPLGEVVKRLKEDTSGNSESGWFWED